MTSQLSQLYVRVDILLICVGGDLGLFSLIIERDITAVYICMLAGHFMFFVVFIK
jgi:hypothetical protein